MKPFRSLDVSGASADRRQTARDPVTRQGLVVFGNPPFQRCLIINLSDAGARLGLDPSAEPPGRFHLYVGGEDQIVEVTVAWRSLEEMGVQFVGPIGLRSEHPEETIRNLSVG